MYYCCMFKYLHMGFLMDPLKVEIRDELVQGRDQRFFKAAAKQLSLL